MRIQLLAAILAVLLLCSTASAQDKDEKKPAPDDSIPAWVLYTLIGIATPIAGGAGEVIRRLYNRANEVEREMLIRYEGDPENPAKPGILPALRARCKEEREKSDQLLADERKRFEEKVDALHSEQKDLLREINATLREVLDR
jgi:hypothetical protein